MRASAPFGRGEPPRRRRSYCIVTAQAIGIAPRRGSVAWVGALMRISLLSCATLFAFVGTLSAQVPDNLVVEGVPAVPAELRASVARYLEFRSAVFNGWHPVRREMLITTRFADATQLHHVKLPGGARKQLTFLPEPVAGGSYEPTTGEFIVFSQDKGGGEFYQLYRYDLVDGRITLLTDGKSRNSGRRWSRSGKLLAYTSTARNGRDNDIHLLDPRDPKTDRTLVEVAGGGWGIADWSQDDAKLLLLEYVSINESYLYFADTKTGARSILTQKGGDKVSYGSARFSADALTVFATTDRDAEFRRLVKIDVATGKHTALTAHIPWDVDEFEVSPDGAVIAFVTNEDGVGVLHLLDAKTARELPVPKLPLGTVAGLEWHNNGRELAFNLS